METFCRKIWRNYLAAEVLPETQIFIIYIIFLFGSFLFDQPHKKRQQDFPGAAIFSSSLLHYCCYTDLKCVWYVWVFSICANEIKGLSIDSFFLQVII